MIALSWQAQPHYFTGLVLLLIFQGLLPLANAWVMKLVFDLLVHSIQAHGSSAVSALAPQLIVLLAAQMGFVIVSQLMGPLSSYCHAELARQVSLRITTRLYQKLNSFEDLSYFEDPRFHNTIQVAGGVQFGPEQVLSAFSSLVPGLVTILAFLGILIPFNPLLAAIVGLAALPPFYVQLKFGRQRFGVALNNSPKERRASYYGRILSWMQAAKEVRLFNLGTYFLHAFVETTREIQQAQRGQQKRELRWQLPLSFLSSAVSTGAFVLVIVQAFAGRLSVGDVSLYTNTVNSTQSALLSLVLAFSQLHQSVLFYREYQHLLALPQIITCPDTPKPVLPLTTGITFRNVSFRYSEQHPWTLHHVDLFLPANTCLALVGLNGAGKTTLVKLLTRLYDPIEGEILWDGIDIRTFVLSPV
jgi:ATP-binding cassette subfamily B protein